MLTVTVLTVVALSFLTASAQIPVRVPKIPKQKAQPTPTETAQPTSTSDTQPTQPQPEERRTESPAPATSSTGPYFRRPAPPETPTIMADTMEIRTETWDYYWKAPGQSNYTSWVPRVRFDVSYAGSTRLRYKAEYFMPDGQLWFSETLEQKNIQEREGKSTMESQWATEDDKKTLVTPGAFGIKISNMRDNSVAFQGKFKVVRYRPENTDVRFKNWFDFYVDQHWNLPIGYTAVDRESLGSLTPSVKMWFKGDLNSKDFEARIFHNGKELATTDDWSGGVQSGERRFPKRRGNDPALFWYQFEFNWAHKLLFISDDVARNQTRNQDKMYINQMPGDYVVKIFYKGDQVRETKFTIADGTFADNGIARQSNITTRGVILPVKVMGTLDKWNPTTWKTDAFYGNPLAGLGVQ